MQEPFPHALPSYGPRTTEWALDILAGRLKADVWVASVREARSGPQWAGGRYGAFAKPLDAEAGHYVNQTLIRPGGKRDDASSIAGLFIFFDDVGDVGSVDAPNAKMDRGWMETFAPDPTFIEETSKNNFQWFYAFDKPCPIKLFQRLTKGLKAHPEAGAGFQDAAGLIRYGRLPSGINPKPGRGKFKTRLVQASGKVYRVEELARAFGISLTVVVDSGNAGLVDSVNKGRGESDDHPLNAPPTIVDQCSIQELEALLTGPLKNDSRFDHRDLYIRLLIWAHGATKGSPEGLDAARAWGDAWTDGKQIPPDDVDKRWDTIHDPHGGASALRWWAWRLDPQGAARVWARFHPLLVDNSVVNTVVDTMLDSIAAGVASGGKKDLTEPMRAVLQTLPQIYGQPVDPTKLKGVGRPGRPLRPLPKTILPGFDRGEVTLLGGRSGAYKSVFLIQVCLAVAHGRPDILGFGAGDLKRRGDCIIFANEDSCSASGLRRDAIVGLHKIDETLPQFDLEVWDERAFIRDPRTKEIRWRPKAVERILEWRQSGRDIALIGLDTLGATIEGGSEETNYEFQMVANLSLQMGRDLNAGVVPVHHVKKGEHEDDDLHSIRGGSALGNSVRNAVILSKPNRDEIKKWGQATCERLTGVTMAKRSNGQLLDKKWFRLTPHAVVGEDDTAPGVATAATSIGLVLENGGKGPVVSMGRMFQDALAEIAAAIDAGVAVRVVKQWKGRPDTVQGVLGMKDADANAIVDSLVAGGLIVLDRMTSAGVVGRIDVVSVTGKGRELLKNEEI